MKTILVILAVFVLFFNLDCKKNTLPPAPVQTDTNNENIVNMANMKFLWKISGDTLIGTLSAPTQGWVSVGFGATDAMKNANIIIGYVSNGNVVISDDYGVSSSSHKADTSIGGTFDIYQYSGYETGDSTFLNFKIPLSSSDTYDYKIVSGENCNVIFAYGKKDDFTSFHSKVGKTVIKF